MRVYMRSYSKSSEYKAKKNSQQRKRRTAPTKARSVPWKKQGTYYSRNRERILEKSFAQSLRQYGLTPASYAALLEKQGGVCAICKQPPVGRRLSIDHDHRCCSSGRSCGACVRGLLHDACNRALGLLQDDTKRLKAAIEYLGG